MPHGLLYGASFTNGVLSFTDKQGRTICSAYLRNYLTLTATSDNSSVALTKVGTLSNEFEVNIGNGWEDYTFGTVIPLKAGQSCKWRCKAHPTTQSKSTYVKFVMTGTIEASGNCNSMLSSDFGGITSLYDYDYAFYSLFRDCTSLTKAPILPATTLSASCYESTFRGCEYLTESPVLPAAYLQKYWESKPTYCYRSLFDGCLRLKKITCLATDYIFSIKNGTSTGAIIYANTDSWVHNVPSGGTFYYPVFKTVFGYDQYQYGDLHPSDSDWQIPYGWERVDITPQT